MAGALGVTLWGADGDAWEVLGAAEEVVLLAAFVLSAVMALRAAGGARTWLGPVAAAAGLTAAALLLAWLVA